MSREPHKPITNEEIAALGGPPARTESQHLDFKQEPYVNQTGAKGAIDIAALANGSGGDLLLGCAEGDTGTFDRFHDWDPQRTKRAAVVEDILRNVTQYLRPRDFVEELRFRVVPVASAASPVVVITVPEAPFLVAAADKVTPDAKLSFPVRVEMQTNYLDTAEVFRRMRDTSKWRRLQFQRLLSRDHGVFLFADFLVEVPHGKDPLLVRPNGGAARVGWMVKEIADDALILRCVGGPGHIKPKGFNIKDLDFPSTALAIPYEMIVCSWGDAFFKEHGITLMLDERVGLLLRVKQPEWSLYRTGSVTGPVLEDEEITFPERWQHITGTDFDPDELNKPDDAPESDDPQWV